MPYPQLIKEAVERVISSWKTAVASGDPDEMQRLGTALYHKRFLYEARDLFSSVIALEKDSHAAYCGLARVDLLIGDGESALRNAREAVSLRPEYPDYRNCLGEILAALHRYKEAVVEFEKSTSINLYYAEAYFNLGLTLLQNALERGDTSLFHDVVTRCVDSFTKAALINRVYAGSEFDRSLECLKKSRLEDAHRSFSAIHVAVNEKARLERIAHYSNLGVLAFGGDTASVEARIGRLERDIHKKPDYVDLRAELAKQYFERAVTAWEQGVGQLKKTMELNPRYKKASAWLEEAEKEYESLKQTKSSICRK